MARNIEIETKEEKPKFPKSLFLLFPKLPFNRKRSVEAVIEKKPNEKQLGDEMKKSKKADVVKLSETRPAAPSPLKLEAQQSERNSNPTILWQVYAIGGFFLLKWIWARWKERKEMGAKMESSDDEGEQPPADDDSQYV
ncbi:uncharacterized protein LOC111310382 isoform X2 [Durio zibethinus]|uniref:Uncharacterized protein LOC111310382 isoform X2 n=1 Tax=Durio zibethinus TaxID=66656 RepID=A0A6P6AKZ3_DURZI|nr:uncharacterized protein LOC111310382 isoform X2 [Durio zibethinus]